MNIKTIQENIVELAMEEMTEDGIHHDDFPDRESEYVAEIVKDLLEINEIELDFYGFTLQEPKWTPEINELYYYVDIEPLGLYEESWSEQKEDKNRLSLNLIFPHTPEGKKQAEARLLEVVAFLKK